MDNKNLEMQTDKLYIPPSLLTPQISFTRYVLIISAVIVALIGTLAISTKLILSRNFGRIEQEQIVQDVKRALDVLQNEIQQINALCLDYAMWDDTYAFVASPSPAYIRANLVDSTFTVSRMNLILIADLAGKIVYAKAFDLQTETETALPDDLAYHLQRGPLLNPILDGGNIEGILSLKSGSLMIAVQPILTSERKGPIRGVLIMGRYLNATEIAKLSEITRIPISVQSLEKQPLSPDLRLILSHLSAETPIYIQPHDEQTIIGYSAIPDIDGRNILLLCVQGARDLHLQGKSLGWYFSIIIISLCLLAGSIVLYLFRKLVRIETARKESLQLYRAVLSNLPDYIIIYQNGKIVYVNESAKRHTGYSPEKINNHDVLDFIAPEHRAMVEEKIRKRVMGEQVGSYEADIINFTGERLHTIIRGEIIPYGKSSAVVTVLTDITERKRAEESLREQKTLLDEIFNGVHEGIGFVDENENIVYCNPAFAALFEKELQSMPGTSLFALFGKESRETIIRQTGERMKGHISTYELPISTPHGEKHLLVTTSPRFKKDGTYAGAFGALLDITARKAYEDELRRHREHLEELVKERAQELHQANDSLHYEIGERKRFEETLRERNEYLAALLKYSPVAIITLDFDGTVESWNPAAETLFLYSHSEAIGNNIDALIAPREFHAEAVAYTQRVRHDGMLHAITKRVRKDGTAIYVELFSVPVVVSDQPVGIIVIYHDITEQQTAYQNLQSEIADHRRTEVALKRSKEAAETANIAKSQFLANMSHEIRTPLNAIIGFSELVMVTASPEQNKTYAGLIFSESNVLLSLINEVLDMAKIESGTIRLANHPFDLAGLLQGVATTMEVHARKKGIAFSISIGDPIPFNLYGDAARLRQILTNIIGNAIKFTEQGEVKVAVGLENSSSRGVSTEIQRAGEMVTLLFTISDSGVGIPPDKLSTIFEPFVQADDSNTRKFGGTGLGTTISKRLAEMMGGQIGVESEVGKGSRFWFTAQFVRRYPTDEKTTTEAASVYFPESDNLFRDTGDLLLVEDYPANQMLLLNHLRNAGYSVDLAKNGNEAIDMAGRKKYDLILMDVQMPGMDGYEATRAIRCGSSPNRKVPIIAMTANAFRSDQEKCYEAGMDDVITKPTPKRLFLEHVWNWLHKTPKTVTQEAGVPTPEPGAAPVTLDESRLAFDFENNTNLVNQMLSLFIANVKGQIVKMKEGVRRGDLDAVRKEAHSIHGGAGNLYAVAVASAAKNLEILCRELKGEDCEQALERLIIEFDRLDDYLQHRRASEGNGFSDPSGSPDTAGE